MSGIEVDGGSPTAAPQWWHETCRCGHEGADHEAGECWATVGGVQCRCDWWEPVQ